VACWELAVYLEYIGRAAAVRMPIITTTISSSIRVNPPRLILLAAHVLAIVRPLFSLSPERVCRFG
jgi:hypothetical protein